MKQASLMTISIEGLDNKCRQFYTFVQLLLGGYYTLVDYATIIKSIKGNCNYVSIIHAK